MSLSDLAEEPAANQPDAESKVDAKQRSERLWAAVASLKERQRIVMVLTLQEYSVTEIAHALDLPVGTVRSNYYRALVVLREILNSTEPRQVISDDTLSGGDALQV